MKRLFLLYLFLSIQALVYSQSWNFLGSSTGIGNATEVDIEVGNNGTLYVAALNGTQLSVKKWVSGSWVNVSTVFTVPAQTKNIQLVTIGNNPVIAYQTNEGSYPFNQYLNIYKFNGTSWQGVSIGSGGYNVHQYSEGYSLSVNQNNQLVLTFFNSHGQANGYYPEEEYITVNIDLETVYGATAPELDQGMGYGNIVSTVNLGNKTYTGFNIEDMGLWTNIYSCTNGGAYTQDYIDDMESADGLKLSTKNGATNVSIAWSKNYSSPYYLKFKSYNSLTFGTPSTITTSQVLDFDMTSYFSDAYIFYKTTSSCFYRKITNVTNPTISLVTSGTSLAPNTATCLKTEVGNGVNIIAYIDGGKYYVKEYNQAANIEDWDYFVMCEGTAFNNNASNSIYLLDQNYSQSNISMTVTSQNVSVIPNSAVSVTGTGLNYSVFITSTNDVTSPTTVDLQFQLLENGTVVDTKLIPIVVNPKPVITFTNTINAVCENANPISLNNWATPSGGTWSGTGITNNIFYPSYPSSANVIMNYTKTNQYGCTSSDQLTFVINQSPDLNVTTTTSDCNQNTGSASVTITNGQSPYTIYWSTGSTQANVSDLAAGQYLVSVTDANNCLSTATSMVGSNGFTQTGVPSAVACFGSNNGSIDVTVTGGNAPLVYAWSNGATTEDINGLTGGPYELTITDAIGCVSTATYIVQEPQQIMLNQMTITNPTCSTTNGQVVASFNGGVTPYTYAWTNALGASVGTNSATLSSIGAGAYTCTVSDANGCSLNSVALVSNNSGPVLVIDTIIASSCAGDGQIQLSVISGNPASYLWTNGSTTQDINNLNPGTYSVTITGINGCVSVLGGTVGSTLPDPVAICLVTVDSTTNTNLVVWEKPVTNAIDHFNIYRETSQAGLYQFAGSVDYDDESVYTDLVASPNVRSWRYKIASVDACGTESEISTHHKTIHLVISQGLGSDINLFWDSYEGFNYSNFVVRKHTNATGWTTIQTMPNNLFTYTDQALDTDGLYYVVTVDAPSTCSSTKMAQDFNTTRSNRDNRLSTGQPNSLAELLDQSVTIFPNPANDFITLSNTSSQTIEASIIDQTSRNVKSFIIQPGQNIQDCKSLSTGVYNLKLETKSIITLKRLVIQK